MKSLYLLLTCSDTYLSRSIRHITADPYTHSALCFTPELLPIYSFGRKFASLAFPAGFTKDRLGKGFLRKHRKMPCVLLELPVEDDAYLRAKELVAVFEENSKDYRYNVLGLILCGRQIAYEREHHFFCSQFVATVLQKSGAAVIPKAPSLMRPADFIELPGAKVVFEGSVHTLEKLQLAGGWEKEYQKK